MPESEPYFSVVTVVRNDLDGLKATQRSLLSQSLGDYEWVVVDGASTDGTADYVRQLEVQVTLQKVSEPDDGIYDAMNKGIAMARGRFVVFMNAGDSFTDDGALESVRSHVEADGRDVDLVFGGATIALQSGVEVYREPRRLERYIWHGLPSNHQATYYRRTRIQKTPYDCQYRICGDYFIVAALYVEGATASYLDRSVARFEGGGTAYQSPAPLFLEPYKIQAEILRTPLYRRVLSFGKRAVSTGAMVLLSQPLIGQLRERVADIRK